MSHTTATSDEITGWFAGRLTDVWFTAAPEITIDREEILVVGPLADVDLPADASDAARAGAWVVSAAGPRRPSGGERRRPAPASVGVYARNTHAARKVPPIPYSGPIGKPH